MKRFFLILFPIFFIGFFRPSYLIPIQNKNKNLFKISKKEYLNSFFKILKANYIKLLVFSYFGYDTTEVIDQSINKYKKIIKPLKILSKSNQILFLIKIIQTYNSILLKNIPACYEQIKRNKNIDQNFILTFPEKQEIKDEFEKSIYKYYKIIYIHGGGQSIRKNFTKKEKIYNRIGILLHSLGFKKCIACINNENTFNTRNATYFYNRLIIFKWNALTCFKNRFETSKKLSQLILKTYSDRKNDHLEFRPILICAESYGNDVLGNSLLELEKLKEKLYDTIFVSCGGLITNRTSNCFINQIKNNNKLILCLAPIDPITNGFDVTNHSNEKDNIFFGYTPTSDRNIIISKAKQLKLEKNICELIIWTFQNNKTTPILHQHLKQTFFNTSIFNIINNFEKFNNGLKTNILMIEKDNPNLPKLIKIINNNTTPQPKL